jgi:ribosomal protein S18 acetylase RimI-like enzyme
MTPSREIDAVLNECDAIAGRALRGGPSATPSDFSAPGGAFVVGFLDGVPTCGGGIKALGNDVGEIKRMYVVPEYRGRGFVHALIQALARSIAS